MEFSTVDLSWLPSDTEEQLALGFRIISNAYKSRISTLETELRSMRALIAEKTDQLAALQKKYSSFEVQLMESTQRGNQLAEENKNLVSTIKKLQKDIDRLETLKKLVLSSIQEDNNEVENSHRFFSTDEMIHNLAPRTVLELNPNDSDDSFTRKKGHSARNMPAAIGINGERETVDGRQFFRTAKSVLSGDDFSSFLATIKKFNTQLQTREETLAHARHIFGEHHPRLLEEFKQLINPKH
ncbi:conserved hypothetical protein [Theileria equi strain WA]|uniref:At4g15545-like C-terminal domain-containing protein n=1 Tax=Theileria equi strain WA TaxID=1537102 RepID=L1LCX9_THEEQ|nr:conserved hypothetical protein [Theileria equi strain WA]EKX73196.1 conserved hypothetical protein [Theileria equi strain WA]|eukprot:XP_004832648.1 conserved hypothetical protein [Theileria equi strain WA]